MTRRSRSAKARPPRENPEVRQLRELKASILTSAQSLNCSYRVVDAPNITDQDQREMLRGQKSGRTLYKKTRLEKLWKREILDMRELKACEWYHDAHEMRYATTGVTANYGGVGGAACTNFDHLPKNRAQEVAFENFEYARAGISPSCLGLFEDVVLRDGCVGKRALAFNVAVEQLMNRIEGRVSL